MKRSVKRFSLDIWCSVMIDDLAHADDFSKRIMRDLYVSGGSLLARTFVIRYAISTSYLFKVVSQLMHLGYVVIEDNAIVATSKGMAMVKENVNLFARIEKKWLEVPEHFIQMQLGINEPVLPRIDQLDKSFFKDNNR